MRPRRPRDKLIVGGGWWIGEEGTQESSGRRLLAKHFGCRAVVQLIGSKFCRRFLEFC